MRKYFYALSFLFLAFAGNLKAATGDTTWVQANHVNLNYYNNFDTAVTFPSGALTYRKIYMIFNLGEYTCAPGTQYCHQWDYDLENYVMTPGGDTFELARFVTPYATSGTPGFSAAWQQHYIYDVTDYYPILKNNATIRVHYSGYSGGFTLDVKFAFIEGTPERNVLGINRLWKGVYTYGNLSNLIDSNVKPQVVTAPTGTQAAEMKVAITGHGSDNTSGCCEFDNTGVGHSYNVVLNSNTIAQTNMNVNCGANELYPQGGTWAWARAGNWCPGGLVSVAKYKLPGITAGNPFTADIDFDDSYDGVSSYGIYNLTASVFYYGSNNHTLDAALEDIIAPTNFEWYRRENPRASAPVIKIRNTGSTAITNVLFEYGVKDSVPVQYVWTGHLAPLSDTIIKLPGLNAITNLSLEGASGLYQFMAHILKVNGQADEDASNDKLTSNFAIAPQWPNQFVINMTTSTLGDNGNIGSNPADASWTITDQNNVVIASRTNTTVHTTYRDTINLNSSGFYTFTLNTSQCLGLSWWALSGQTGYTAGSIVVRDPNNGNATIPLNNNYYASQSSQYHDDFGCGFVQYFTTLGQCTGIAPPTISRIGDMLAVPAGLGTYQWYYNGVAVNGATSNTFTMTHNNGNYAVKVTDASGCSSMSANFALINLGTIDVSDLSSVSISPNPTRGQFTLQVAAELIGTSYSLSDLSGRKIYSGDINGEKTTLSVAGLSSGIYLLNIGNQNKQSFKIVKD